MCVPCRKRNNGGGGRIIPVNPKKRANKTVRDGAAVRKGNTLRKSLRYTGR